MPYPPHPIYSAISFLPITYCFVTELFFIYSISCFCMSSPSCMRVKIFILLTAASQVPRTVPDHVSWMDDGRVYRMSRPGCLLLGILHKLPFVPNMTRLCLGWQLPFICSPVSSFLSGVWSGGVTHEPVRMEPRPNNSWLWVHGRWPRYSAWLSRRLETWLINDSLPNIY